jgi:DNA-binding MarR family transcriptional regulator
VTNRWRAAQRDALQPFELTHVQFVLVAAFIWLGVDGPVIQKQLTRFCGTDPMMTSHVVGVLEQRALIDRAEHSSDDRSRALAVT